jgi:hypothetical protein
LQVSNALDPLRLPQIAFHLKLLLEEGFGRSFKNAGLDLD